MSTTTAYGSITIVDITDIGEFSIYPMANSPLSVVYDPNQNTYTPDWSSNNLTLTPMVYYAGKQLPATTPETTPGLTVTWKRKEGINAESALQSGETVANNSLTVSANKLADSTSGLLTYICTAKYVEPESQTELSASGQITFSLIKHATNVKKCSITGENVFKYNTNSVLVGADNIVLTATVSNVSISKWQYKNTSGAWTDYPVTAGHNTDRTSATLKVYANEDVFVNDVATIRVTTSDNSVSDICTVVKLRDGAPGEGTVTAVLSNDDQWIACDNDGDPLDGALAQAFSQITIYEGGADVTSSWTITCTSNGATGSYNEDTHTYTVTGISATSANIQFNCVKTGYANIVKNFSLTKLIAAKDGDTPTIYSVSPSVLAANRSIENAYSPTSVTFTAYSQTGASDKTQYTGYFKIYENDSTDPTYTSPNDEESCSYTFSGSSLKSVRCVLYKAGGGGDPVDSQTVVVTSDGAPGGKGDKGDDGVAATNVVLGNQADIIPCYSDGSVKSDMTLTIPFTGYLGTAKAACTVAVSGLPTTGITVQTNTAGTTSQSGSLELYVSAGSKLGDTNSGTITLTFTCNGTTVLHYYQWSKSIQAENAVLLQIYAPNGNMFNNGTGSVILQAQLTDGSTDKTASATYKWYKYGSGSYTQISGETNGSLSISASSVDGYASYKCEATYGGQTYDAYYSVFDKTDPVQAQVYCSLGTQILNSKGYGAVYTRIFRNGEEIDPIKSERFLTDAPTGAKTGDFYYHLDTTNKTVTLMKYNGSEWSDATGTDLPTASYTYTFRDKDGNIANYNGSSSLTGKAIYIDGSLFKNKIVMDVAVTV